MSLKPDNYVQLFLLCHLRGVEHFLYARGISRNRFFHEHVLSLFDTFTEMLGPESGWGCKNNNISQRDGLFVCIESDELILFRHVDPVPKVSGFAGYIRQIIRCYGIVAAVEVV